MGNDTLTGRRRDIRNQVSNFTRAILVFTAEVARHHELTSPTITTWRGTCISCSRIFIEAIPARVLFHSSISIFQNQQLGYQLLANASSITITHSIE